MYGGLKCPACGNEEMKLRVDYTGADWESEAGEGSGYGCEVSLNCTCGRIYPICFCRDFFDVSPMKA